MPWRWAGWTAAALLLVVAGVLLTRSVEVGPPSSAASCGSAWDVVTGRADWSLWWAQDGAAPVHGSRPVRALDCPGAVDVRLALVGVVVALGSVTVAAAELPHARRTRSDSTAPPPLRRLRRVGTVLLAGGSLLTAAGVVGLLIVTGDPHAVVFDYADRSTVVLAGLLLLLPAVLLAALGAVTRAAARALEDRDVAP